MPRNTLLVALAVIALILSSCGSGASTAALPDATCQDTLAIGTACVPPASSYARSAFSTATGPDDVAPLMEDGRFAGTLRCAEKPEDSLICLVGGSGAVLVFPVQMPENREVEFTGGDLPQRVTVDLTQSEPVGVRYEGPSINVAILNNEGTVLYSVNSVETAIVESSGAEADG